MAREVEVVLESVPEVLRPRPDLHQVERVPRPAQRDGRLVVEQQVDVQRVVGLARAALLFLLDQADDGRKALGERLLIGEVSGRGRSPDDREARDDEQDAREGQRSKANPLLQTLRTKTGELGEDGWTDGTGGSRSPWLAPRLSRPSWSRSQRRAREVLTASRSACRLVSASRPLPRPRVLDPPIHPPESVQVVRPSLSRPLRSIRPVRRGGKSSFKSFETPLRGEVATPPSTKAGSAALQRSAPRGLMPPPIVNFEGVDNRNFVLPPDTEGDIGPNHYLQWVNLSFAVYDRTGGLVYGPADGNTLFTGLPACGSALGNGGDPIVLYDQFAGRWLASQLAYPNLPNGPVYQCVAVSSTDDPTGPGAGTRSRRLRRS